MKIYLNLLKVQCACEYTASDYSWTNIAPKKVSQILENREAVSENAIICMCHHN